ncbi:hypothetical protein [Nonomuraea sp. NPDC050643]|uniref:hypothetical protein n=1 Tax=Nonomuraea sp. NPDC050643 TaxID=3155660 RepID=UPI0033E91E01
MKERGLARRYWHALIDSRPYEALDQRSFRHLTLWQRYWTALLGPPPPAPRRKRRLTLSFVRLTLPVAATAMALVVGMVVVRPLLNPSGGNIPAGTGAPSEETPRLLYRETVRLPVPAKKSGVGFWKVTSSGTSRAGAGFLDGNADFAVSGDGARIRVDGTRARTGVSPAECLRHPPSPAAPGAGEDEVGPSQAVCLLTRSHDLAYLTFGPPAGGRLTVRVDLWSLS